MKPINFPEATDVLQKPKDADIKCEPLPIFTDGLDCVSCWKPSWVERIRILFGHPVYLGIFSGHTQPPVWVEAEYPFIRQKPKRLAMIKEFFFDLVSLFRIGYTQKDKRKHFIVGMILSFVLGITWHLIGYHHACVFGFLVGAFAGFAKEWWDSKGHGRVEVMDFVFTALGAFVAMGLTFLFTLII